MIYLYWEKNCINMKQSVYRPSEIRGLMKQMLSIYDLVRLVDPNECQELHLNEDDVLRPQKGCYEVWSSDKRCANCSSFMAAQCTKRMEKTEYFDGKTFHILSLPVAIQNSDNSLSSCVMECITIKDGIEENATEGVRNKADSALVDTLTDIYNWDGFYKMARRAINAEPDGKWSVVVYNIVRFKMVNDIFGRNKGNEILIRMAQLIRSKLSDNEVCARLRGDRFAALVHSDNLDERFDLTEINDTNLTKDSPFHLHIRLGIFNVTNKDLPVSSMCDRAMIALSSLSDNSAKQKVVFDETMMDKMVHEQLVEDECEKAIRHKEFQIYLQPQVMKDGTIIGAEALARWVREDGQIVPPVDFIEVMEKSELISKLDLYVWEEAAKKLCEWKNSDLKDLYISVNISPKDFFYVDVYEVFDSLVKKYQIDKSKLKLEITETMMMNDAMKQLSLVNRLHSEGFEIEIDDFGKGYSSLSLLKDIDADTLKIDKEFLNQTENDKKSESILGSVIAMSDRLDMDVITEGVETRKQLDRMISLGCDRFQGYYFAKPLPVKEFEELYKNRNGVLS